MKTYKDKKILIKAYEKYGTSRRVAKNFGVSIGTIIYWRRKLNLPKILKLYLYDNNSGKGRLNELYILGHPLFKKFMKDLGLIDDKMRFDVIWHGDKVNIKSSHAKRFMFRVKVEENGRHVVAFYICCCYEDGIDPMIPIEIFIIPSRVAPYSTITISNIQSGKYAKYRLSLKRGIDFSADDEKKYNQEFRKRYSKYLKKLK